MPVTDEKAPKDSDFELLIQRLWNVPTDAALVFNCQMGRGRTTTGMIIATLLVLRRLGAYPTGKAAGRAVGISVVRTSRRIKQAVAAKVMAAAASMWQWLCAARLSLLFCLCLQVPSLFC